MIPSGGIKSEILRCNSDVAGIVGFAFLEMLFQAVVDRMGVVEYPDRQRLRDYLVGRQRLDDALEDNRVLGLHLGQFCFGSRYCNISPEYRRYRCRSERMRFWNWRLGCC